MEYIDLNEEYKLRREENHSITANVPISYYYRLYVKTKDDFGNVSWNQVWSGRPFGSGSDGWTGLLASFLFAKKD